MESEINEINMDETSVKFQDTITTRVLDFHDYGLKPCKNTNKNNQDESKSIPSKLIESSICPECKHIFTHRRTLKRHIKRKHPVLFQNLFTSMMHIIRPHKCIACEKNFKSIRSLQAHKRNFHKHLAKIKQHKCPLCSQMFERKKIYEHFEKSHALCLKNIKLNFNSYDEFCEWKKAIERITKSSFSKENTRISNGITHHMFICHRSGFFISKVTKNQRKLKSQGSRKIDAFCPATMKVAIMTHGRCEAKFQSQHVGHESELQHLNLTHDERKYVADKLASNLPLNDILNDIRNSASEDGAERLCQITRYDLHNIKSSLLMKDNQFYFPETKPDQKLLKDLRDIHNKHAESGDIRADITETEKGWLLTFTESNEICLIKENFKSCDCILVCVYCRVCIKSYICSCSDSSLEGNMCKHIHFFCMERNKMLYITDNKDSMDSNNDEAKQLQISNNELAPQDMEIPRIISIYSEKVTCLKNKFCDLLDTLTTEEEYKISESIFEELTSKLKCIEHDSIDKDNAGIPAINNLSKFVCGSDKKQDPHNSHALKMTQIDKDTNGDIPATNNLSKFVCINTKKQDLHSSKMTCMPLLLHIPKPSGKGVKFYAVSISQKPKTNI